MEQNRLSAEPAKAEFLRAKATLLRSFATTSDDRVNWSPAPTARTPIHLVAHSAISIGGLQRLMVGGPFDFANLDAFDAYSRSVEQQYDKREAVLELLESECESYVSWLDSLGEEQLASTSTCALWSIPMMVAITFNADHMRRHAAQIDYIQTAYGDRSTR